MISTFLILVLFLLQSSSFVHASCPVCIVTLGGGMVLAKKLGVNDLLASIWLSGLNTAISFFIADKIKKPKILKNPFIFSFIMLLTAFWYFSFTDQIAYGTNLVIGNIDKISLGLVLGFISFILSYLIDQFIRSKRNGKVLFYYQKVIIPALLLAIITILSKIILL